MRKALSFIHILCKCVCSKDNTSSFNCYNRVHTVDAQGCLRGLCQLKGQPTASQHVGRSGNITHANECGSPLVQRVCHVLKMESHHQLGCFINLPHYTLLSITDGEAVHFGLCPKINRTSSTTFINIWIEWEEKCSANEETMLKFSFPIWERITGHSLEDQKLFMEMAIQPLLFRSQLTGSQLSSENA